METASNKFKLIGPCDDEFDLGSAVTLSCHLSPEVSAVDLEIRWFKETECACLYKNRQVTEGRGYEGRVSLFTQGLQRSNVSLQITNSIGSDVGYYLCQVTDGDTTLECTATVDHKALQRVVKTAQRTIGTELPTIEDIYHKHCLGKARNIVKDITHPNHGLFSLLPSGRHYRSLRSRTSRLRKSFFPEAVILMNTIQTL
ncbi:butyrophilin-like protein 3 [Hoplias malabaricus]|uniref:butyrophilin-like protein 3 n=1 Tax=Hoplias malabaricus TaxID=27720 RepID=UPI003462BA79